MPYCPNNHGHKNSRFCDECGAETVTTPPATSDKLNIRSPEARAESHVNQHFHLGDAPPGAKPAYYRCPQCGRRNQEHEVFDCMGECGREHLCLRHQDEEYEVCVRCARALRKEDEQEEAALRKLEAERDKWQEQAQKAEAILAELKKDKARIEKEWSQAQKALQKAQQTQERAQARAAELETTLAALNQETARKQEQQQQKVTKAQRARDAAQARVQKLEKELTQWRKRSEKAESKLAEIERKRQQAANRGAPSRSPNWQQIGIEMIKIPAGEFLYGDDKKKVYLGDYRLAKTPVTNAQYKVFVDATGHRKPSHWKNGNIPNGKENHPVVEVSWDDAQAFCQWVGLRLPTEQEWEKGARGTDGREYPWGDHDPNASLCNFDKNVGDTTPVTRYSGGASPYGLLNMAGNVWEWCEDWYDSDCKYRVLRGGSWYVAQDLVRSFYRYIGSPDLRDSYIGFRCALSQ